VSDANHAARTALAQFGIVAAGAELISVSENLTFRVVEQHTGDTYVLRLHRPGYHDAAELRSEQQWLRALSEAGISVPAPVQTAEGREFATILAGPEGRPRHASMSRWVDGERAAELLRRRSDPLLEQHYFARLGALMAQLHNQASCWTPPAGFTRKRLDADGLLGHRPHFGRFWEYHSLSAQEQRTMLRARDAIVRVLLAYGDDARVFSMIHADMNDENLVIDGDRLTVIDFDDAAFGWHLFDIATALNGCADPVTDASEAAFLAGYRSIRALRDTDLALLPMFRLIRGMAVLGWKGERPEVPWEPGRLDRLRTSVLARAAAFDARAR
jgi:Ser/Thr protein kinase RdoA (MazF antagonist)